MRPETGVTRRHQTMGMLGEEVQMGAGFAVGQEVHYRKNIILFLRQNNI
jgi:hypothetical protein